MPDDFPDVAKWADAITRLYEHRLRADYDNWVFTEDELSVDVTQAVALASDFVSASTQYLQQKFGITP